MLKAAGWPGEGHMGLPLYLVGGSWRALSRLDLEITKDPLAVLDQHTFPRTAIRRLIRASKRLTFEELRAIPGMASNRAASLPDAGRAARCARQHPRRARNDRIVFGPSRRGCSINRSTPRRARRIR
jgi:exopolyphosphatase/pppGpp-phosphohydrolase